MSLQYSLIAAFINDRVKPPITLRLHFHRKIPTWRCKYSKTLICLTFWVQQTLGKSTTSSKR